MARAAYEPADDPDAELLRRIAERDHGAFEILHRRYARPVYGLALRRLRDRGQAADATARAFAAIRGSAASFVPGRGDGARWLFTVASDAIVDGARAPSMAEDGWSVFRVHAAVVELPEHERVPIELAYWAGRSRSEIAELLGLPVGTLEARIRSALARLAAQLEGFD